MKEDMAQLKMIEYTIKGVQGAVEELQINHHKLKDKIRWAIIVLVLQIVLAFMAGVWWVYVNRH
jgi:hypothetical protein